MNAYLEIWRPSGTEVLELQGELVTIGREPTNDVTLGEDDEVSRLHAVLERLASNWCLRDLGSRNGTHVAGNRLLGQCVLHDGDQIRIGSSNLFFRVGRSASGLAPVAVTKSAESPPALTRREKEVLVALCRPMLAGAPFPEPATTRDIAASLFVTENAVKQHLVRLYDKFRIEEGGERRRVRLANEAVRRGAVAVAELDRERRHQG